MADEEEAPAQPPQEPETAPEPEAEQPPPPNKEPSQLSQRKQSEGSRRTSLQSQPKSGQGSQVITGSQPPGSAGAPEGAESVAKTGSRTSAPPLSSTKTGSVTSAGGPPAAKSGSRTSGAPASLAKTGSHASGAPASVAKTGSHASGPPKTGSHMSAVKMGDSAAPYVDPNNQALVLLYRIREPIADYQALKGISRAERYSFVNLLTSLCQQAYAAFISIFTMLYNLLPLLDSFSYFVRFILDKLIEIVETPSVQDMCLKTSIFLGELIVLVFLLYFIVTILLAPIIELSTHFVCKIFNMVLIN